MARLSGAEILARALRSEGIDTIFSLPGEPISSVDQWRKSPSDTKGFVTAACKQAGIRLLNFRHEQAAAMAAQAYAYTTRRPGVALVASGPAMTYAMTGLTTAWANCWPILLIGGSSHTDMRHRGDFQELPQVELAAPLCKWSVAIDSPQRVPYYLNSAIRRMMTGRPGPVYLDLPANVISGEVEETEIQYFPCATPVGRPLADSSSVGSAVELLRRAERPLLLIGKGLAWSDAGDEARELVDRFHIPFVPSPMGKGVIPDDHPLNVATARTFALRQADLVILAGARFNWIFHFGQPPRFAPGVEVIQLDMDPAEVGNGVPAAVGLVGDAKAVLRQVLSEAGMKRRPSGAAWLQSLAAEGRKNTEAIAALVNSEEAPMNMYRMYRDIAQVLDRDATVCADGETNMAISRVMIPNYLPRHRLDAGVSGCMGVAVPYALGAQVARPGKQVVSVNGDYAFGWAGFEIETAVRYKLPILFVVANNVTVGGPQWQDPDGTDVRLPAQPNGIRYDRLMETFGGHGEYVETPKQLRPALERALSAGGPALVNVVISKKPQRKSQQFMWMTPAWGGQEH